MAKVIYDLELKDQNIPFALKDELRTLVCVHDFYQPYLFCIKGLSGNGAHAARLIDGQMRFVLPERNVNYNKWRFLRKDERV